MTATSSEAGNSSKSLRREVGIFGATMMGLGAIGVLTLLRSSPEQYDAMDIAPPIDVTFGGFLEACALMKDLKG